jgi:hypothetical protein
MRAIIGTYRLRNHIETALKSLDTKVIGITDLVFVDDSGSGENAAWLSQYGKVIETNRGGYNVAMKAACAAADNEEAFWFEEDFEVLARVDLSMMSEILYHRPYLAELALLRGPHFEIEHQHGGLIDALVAQGHVFRTVSGVIEQTATFTTNPAVIRADVWNTGWPDGNMSEDSKRDELLSRGYRFGFMPRIILRHNGIRSGYGY